MAPIHSVTKGDLLHLELLILKLPGPTSVISFYGDFVAQHMALHSGPHFPPGVPSVEVRGLDDLRVY